MLHINEEMYYNSTIFAIPHTEKNHLSFHIDRIFPSFLSFYEDFSIQTSYFFPNSHLSPPPNLIFNPAYQYNEKLPVYLQKSFIE